MQIVVDLLVDLTPMQYAMIAVLFVVITLLIEVFGKSVIQFITQLVGIFKS